MGTIAEKLEYLEGTKTDIKNAIIEKGQSVSSSDTFRSYGDKIRAITPNLSTKAITANGTYKASDEQKDGYSEVSVNVPISGNIGTLSVTENGTYNSSDEQLDGYSSVTVNVSGGGGGPQGTPVTARALVDLSTNDTVYVMDNSSGGQAQETSLPDGFSVYSDTFAYDGTYVYFTKSSDDRKIVYRVQKDNLTASPQTYYTSTAAVELYRNLMNYVDESAPSTYRYIKNLVTGATLKVSKTAYGWGTTNNYPSGFTQFYFRAVDTSGTRRNTDIQTLTPNTSFVAGNGTAYSTFENVNVRASDYQLYRSNSSAGTKSWPSSDKAAANGYNVIGNYLITIGNTNNPTPYEVRYTEIGTTEVNKFVNPLTQQTLVVSGSPVDWNVGWNSEGTKLFVCLGNNGVAIIDTNLRVKVYSNIATPLSNTAYKCRMFHRYFYSGFALYDLGDEDVVMSKPASKSSPGQLGYVQQGVQAGQTGTAIILFS